MNHHEILGLSQAASSTEIQQAFRKAALEHHPDHSDSPEAAEAFARIKEARDTLLEQVGPREDIASIRQGAARAFTATHAATTTHMPPPLQDPKVVAKVQKLDDAVYEATKFRFFKRSPESEEVAKHRKKLRLNNRRIQGLY